MNANGIAQAKAAADSLSETGLSRFVASPADRVLKTAGFVAELTGAPMYVDTDLVEMHVGAFEGLDILAITKAHGLSEHDLFIDILPEDAALADVCNARMHCGTMLGGDAS